MKNRIKVSIVVPVYNNEAYLRQCLDSLAGQTLKDIEIICVNDGSTDSSPDIIREYVQKDDRFVMIDKPNGGYGHSMNRGFEKAQGEYIGIVESDDFALSDMYETLYAAAKEHDCDIVKSDFSRFETVDGQIKATVQELTNDKSWYGRVIDPKKEPLCLKLKMNTWTGIYRREFIEKYGIDHHETPGAAYQDNGFFFKTMTQASKVYFINRAFYMNRRDNPGSSVFDKGKVYAVNREMAYIKDFLTANDLWATFKDQFYYKMLSNYEFTYQRIAEERRDEYLLSISEEFKSALESGDLVMENSYTANETARVNILIERPLAYPLYLELQSVKSKNRKLSKELSNVKNELKAVRSSSSYRLARMLTYVPRKVRGLIRK